MLEDRWSRDMVMSVYARGRKLDRGDVENIQLFYGENMEVDGWCIYGRVSALIKQEWRFPARRNVQSLIPETI